MKALIIDEHPAILQGLKCVLSDNPALQLQCLGDLKNAQLPKDILLADIIVLGIPRHLPQLFDSIKRMREINSTVPILIYGADKDSPVIERLMTEPVQGIVAVQYDFSKLEEALLRTACYNGSGPLQFGFKHSRYADFTSDLSQREMEVVYLIAEEKTTSEISRQLNITISTVENHRKNIFRKMGARNLAGMIMTATKAGYIA